MWSAFTCQEFNWLSIPLDGVFGNHRHGKLRVWTQTCHIFSCKYAFDLISFGGNVCIQLLIKQNYLQTKHIYKVLKVKSQMSYYWTCYFVQVFPSNHVKTALKTVFDRNVMGFANGNMGAINGTRPDGKKDITSCQSEEFWTGVTSALAAQMVQEVSWNTNNWIEETAVTTTLFYNVVLINQDLCNS